MWTFAADRSRTRSLQLLLLALTLPGVLAAGLDPGDLDAPVAADGAWLSEVERRIARAEYEITWQTATALDDLAASWHAPNRAQGFRTYFTEAGIRVVPRTAEKPSWEWSLKLSGWGRPGAVQSVEAASLRPEGNRIDYDRGRLVEWYVNETRGLEQGFTLSGPPAGGAQDAVELAGPSEVWIELTLGGTLRPVVSTDGQAIDFATPGGAPAIHYAHLAVADAIGQVLPARMEGFPGGIRLVFEDEDAVYPVTVDPLATAAAWTAERDQAIANFGWSVATAGDVNGDCYSDVIVGADYSNDETNEGRAYVFYGNDGAGLSLRPQQRRVNDTSPIDHLCLSDSPEGFGLALLGRSPFGRGRVKLEWEVKPLGEPLNGIDTQTAVHWSDSNTAGAALSQRVADLVDDTLYHWRVRMRYDPVTTPFQGRSRWLTVPRGGWQEAMLRTLDLTAAGGVDALVMDQAGGVQITLSWGASCLVTDTDYAIYEGTLGQFTSHTSRYCNTAGATTKTFTPLAGDTYYLVVPLSATREGSYGTNSGGSERFVGDDACLPQQIGDCE